MAYLFQHSQHRKMIEDLNIHHHNMAVEKAEADVRRRRKERRIEIRLKELTKGTASKLLWSEGKRGRGNLPRLHRIKKPPLDEDAIALERDRALRMVFSTQYFRCCSVHRLLRYCAQIAVTHALLCTDCC